MRCVRSCLLLLIIISAAGCASNSDRDVGQTPEQDGSSDADSNLDVPESPDAVKPDSALADNAVDETGIDSWSDVDDVMPLDLTDVGNDLLDDSIQPPDAEVVDGVENPDTVDAEVVPQCEADEDCPVLDGLCVERACVDGQCGVTYLANEAPGLADDVEGDCQWPLCDGSGGYVLGVWEEDVPLNTNPCVVISCDGASPVTEYVAVNTSCGADLVCDGLGHCVGCLADSECPGEVTECRWPLCEDGVCGFAFAELDTPLTEDSPTDCLDFFCDGQGQVYSVPDDFEVPVDDGSECTLEQCEAGSPALAFADLGTDCTFDGGHFCDGQGSCVECLEHSDCGVDTTCGTVNCGDDFTCQVLFAMAGTPTQDPYPGDCQALFCDGQGVEVSGADNADLPSDPSECLQGNCLSGTVSSVAIEAGTPCTENGGALCDGLGNCVQCLVATDCPGQDSECATRTCFAGVCGMSFTAFMVPVSSSVYGDCQVDVCDGMGGIVTEVDNTDLPIDGNQCTGDVCTNGVPSNPLMVEGVACSQNGGSYCSGFGTCVQCTNASQCPGTDTDCQTRTCNSGYCGFNYAAFLTPTSSQSPGDCVVFICSGSGDVYLTVDKTDVPVDGNQCTNDICTSGSPSNPPVAQGTACNQNGGTVCSASGACVQCNQATDCPPGPGQCDIRTCNAGVCGIELAVSGTFAASQTPGDCQANVCDELGSVVSVSLNDDIPADDGNQCTVEVCTNGVPSHPPAPLNTSCSQNFGLVCNASGTCVECNTASQCPGTDTQCSTRTCTSNACGFSFTTHGTMVTSQTAGDCKANVCNGMGNIISINQDTDIPADDEWQCTSEVCNNGVPSHPPAPIDTPCDQFLGSVCAANAACVECNYDWQCPGEDTDCTTRTCTSNHCGEQHAPNGTPASSQTVGDCRLRVCDGGWAIVSIVSNTDLPNDNNQCTMDFCQNGVPIHPSMPENTPCNQNGGTKCDGMGHCI